MALEQREADVLQHDLLVERQLHVIEHDRPARPARRAISLRRSARARLCPVAIHAQYISEISTLRDEEIGGDHRDRSGDDGDWSSPCRRPACRRVVRSPTWQAIVTITKPSTNGLISPIQTSCMYRPSVTDDQ